MGRHHAKQNLVRQKDDYNHSVSCLNHEISLLSLAESMSLIVISEESVAKRCSRSGWRCWIRVSRQNSDGSSIFRAPHLWRDCSDLEAHNSSQKMNVDLLQSLPRCFVHRFLDHCCDTGKDHARRCCLKQSELPLSRFLIIVSDITDRADREWKNGAEARCEKAVVLCKIGCDSERAIFPIEFNTKHDFIYKSLRVIETCIAVSERFLCFGEQFLRQPAF
jgi:hypothetical protein